MQDVEAPRLHKAARQEDKQQQLPQGEGRRRQVKAREAGDRYKQVISGRKGRQGVGAHKAVGEVDVAGAQGAVQGHVGDVGEQVHGVHGGARGEYTGARVLWRRPVVRVQPVPVVTTHQHKLNPLC